MASAKCAIDGCKRVSDTVCDHCHEQVCMKHFIEHVKSANVGLTFLTDELNALVNSIQHDDFTRFNFERIERWRQENHRRVDELCERRKQELKDRVNEKIDSQIKKLRELSREVKDLIDDGDASFKQIERVKKSLTEIREHCEQLKTADCLQSNAATLDLTDNLTAQKLFLGDGTLLSIDHQIKLNEFYGNDAQLWSLIYKAKRDGFSHADFHRCCDDQGPTITVIESAERGYLFGGYASVSWCPAQNYLDDRRGPFLFTLINPYGILPTKYPVKIPAFAIYAHTNYCSTFGGGHDIYVCSDNFPHSYIDTTAHGTITFTGETNFQTRDIEVYQLVQS